MKEPKRKTNCEHFLNALLNISDDITFCGNCDKCEDKYRCGRNPFFMKDKRSEYFSYFANFYEGDKSE